ncbi:MAG: flavodoxin family protein [Candidatus Methanomethylophilaceae archaeon]|nr:flavodoxin family protein [Candidatus Methanomethylophilaceae archaeon]
MRVVVLVGSMRKSGNTHMLAHSFAKGASVNNEVEVVSISDYDVKPCTGCNYCYRSERNRCRIDDGMSEIYGKLARADVVAVASPVYFYGISASLKAVVDRLHTPLRNGFRIRGLALLLVGATELPDLFDSILLQYRQVLRFFDLEDMGTVLVGGVKDEGDIEGNVGLEEAYRLGLSIG